MPLAATRLVLLLDSRDTISPQTKTITCLCLLAYSVLFLSSALSAQELKFANLGEFKLETGEVIHDCRIGYRAFGKLNADASNAVLFPTWAGGTTEELKVDIGAKGMVNDADYFVIAIDAFANGVSSSPSNSARSRA